MTFGCGLRHELPDALIKSTVRNGGHPLLTRSSLSEGHFLRRAEHQNSFEHPGTKLGCSGSVLPSSRESQTVRDDACTPERHRRSVRDVRKRNCIFPLTRQRSIFAFSSWCGQSGAACSLHTPRRLLPGFGKHIPEAPGGDRSKIELDQPECAMRDPSRTATAHRVVPVG